MKRVLAFLVLSALSSPVAAYAGDAEIKAAQSVVDSQLRAFQSDDGATAYSFASPTIKQMFPTMETFMSMVTNGYPPVRKPKSFAFGKSEEMGGGAIAQQVLIVGPDGKDYEALYTLELQADGTYKITGCSLKASNSLTT